MTAVGGRRAGRIAVRLAGPSTPGTGNHELGTPAAPCVAGIASANFTGDSTVRIESSASIECEFFDDVKGATVTAVNSIQVSLVSDSPTFHHADALQGGVPGNASDIWNPQFVRVPGAVHSRRCIGGGEGSASGNSTTADAVSGRARLREAFSPYSHFASSLD
jgi:hypothetical protein